MGAGISFAEHTLGWEWKTRVDAQICMCLSVRVREKMRERRKNRKEVITLEDNHTHIVRSYKKPPLSSLSFVPLCSLFFLAFLFFLVSVCALWVHPVTDTGPETSSTSIFRFRHIPSHQNRHKPDILVVITSHSWWRHFPNAHGHENLRVLISNRRNVDVTICWSIYMQNNMWKKFSKRISLNYIGFWIGSKNIVVRYIATELRSKWYNAWIMENPEFQYSSVKCELSTDMAIYLVCAI